MRKKIRGFHFQRTPLIHFLRRGRTMEFEVSPLFIDDWASAIYSASTYNFVDEETTTDTQQAA